MARTRNTKKLAQRIDLNYFKRPTPLKRAKLLLSVLLPLLALVWVAWRGLSGDHRVYSSGRMSEAHAVLEKECSACHVQTAGTFSAKAADSACLDCHDGPAHHDSKTAAPNCAACHVEHRGRINVRAASSEVCTGCHKDLRKGLPNSFYISGINSFQDGHPEIAASRGDGLNRGRDLSSIKLNHAIHMKPIRRGPNGPSVQLQCGNCHRSIVADADLTYADPEYRTTAVSYNDKDEFLSIPADTFKPSRPASGRELMAPVKFANACAACHLLTFDKRFEGGVPHDKPDAVHAFLVKTFHEYIATHPTEVRVRREPSRELTGKPLPPLYRSLTPEQWVMERTAESEDLLWRKTCKQCHTLISRAEFSRRIIELSVGQESDFNKLPSGSTELPAVVAANITLQWMPHAKFDHDAHRGFSCVSCHAKALTSTESSDVLLPGIETCKKCHAPGPEHAESRCFECHTYHDWSKRKEVTPKFTLPELRSGGR